MSWFSDILLAAGIIAAGAAIGLAVFVCARVIARFWFRKMAGSSARHVWEHSARGLSLLLPLIGAYASVPFALETPSRERTQTSLAIAIIVVSAYLLIAMLRGIEALVTSRLDLDHGEMFSTFMIGKAGLWVLNPICSHS